MSSVRNVPSRCPPAPSVEDEPESLARELHGLCHLGDKPGVAGARARGAVDQHPVIMSVGAPSPSTTPPSVPGLGNVSSDESAGPLTPTANTHEPVFRATTASLSDAYPRPDPLAIPKKTHGRPPRPQVHQESSRDVHSRPGSRPPSRSRDGSLSGTRAPFQVTSHSSRGMGGSDHTRSHGHVYETYVYPAKSSLRRSNSERYGPSTERTASALYRSESNPGYKSESVTTGYRSSPPRSQPAVYGDVQRQLPTPPTLAERIEEKLNQRKDRRYTISVSDAETRNRAANVKPLNTALNLQIPTSAPYPPSHEPSRVPSYRYHREQTSAPPFRTTSVPPSQTRSCSDAPASVALQRSTSESGSMPGLIPSNGAGPCQPAARQPVSEPAQTSSPPRRNRSQRSPSRHQSTSQRSNTAGLCISPCPRSIPVSGQQVWYTLKGLTHLDICPSCMSQIAHSRFRNYFIPSLPKPVNQKTRCAFASPWTRLAWAQMIKKRHDSLEMLYQMTRPPPGTRPCPGRIVSSQTWYRIVDPDTGLYLPRFHICSSCARNARILMPAHRDTFQPSPEPQEALCDFVTTSPRFVQYIDLLDAAATRAETAHSTHPDSREFLAYARRKVVLRDCRRDRPILSTWHCIPSLPELSVCEDCYDEVIWPLVKSHCRIARLFSSLLRLLPGDDGPSRRGREASCQLYSPRMRARFRDAVEKDDFALLKSLALRRVEAERRFRDRRDELLEAEERGYDCHEEIRKAVEEWRRWE